MQPLLFYVTSSGRHAPRSTRDDAGGSGPIRTNAGRPLAHEVACEKCFLNLVQDDETRLQVHSGAEVDAFVVTPLSARLI